MKHIHNLRPLALAFILVVTGIAAAVCGLVMKGQLQKYVGGYDDKWAVAVPFLMLRDDTDWQRMLAAKNAPAPDPQPDPEPAPEPEPEPDPEPEPEPQPPVVVTNAVYGQDESYFDDAVFIGDSFTDGFRSYAGLPNAHYLCHNGLTVWSAVEKADFPGGETLAQALSGKRYGKVYILLGINELGTGSATSWANQYKVLVDEVRRLQPDAIIFLQAIFHTTKEKSDSTYFKNSVIDSRNGELKKLADGENIFFIDSNPVFDNGSGALRADYSGDGVHVKAAYYSLWRDYLYHFGVVR